MSTLNYGADENWVDCPARDGEWYCSLLEEHSGEHEWEHDTRD